MYIPAERWNRILEMLAPGMCQPSDLQDKILNILAEEETDGKIRVLSADKGPDGFHVMAECNGLAVHIRFCQAIQEMYLTIDGERFFKGEVPTELMDKFVKVYNDKFESYKQETKAKRQAMLERLT